MYYLVGSSSVFLPVHCLHKRIGSRKGSTEAGARFGAIHQSSGLGCEWPASGTYLAKLAFFG